MYLVSACLAGIDCRYDGRNSSHRAICELVKQGNAIPLCPEQLAGLPTPRACCEIVTDDNGNKKILSTGGEDFTKEFIVAAKETLEIVKIIGVKKAILQSRSPSCGYGCIYDGNFSGTLKQGNGFTAELLVNNGIEVYTEKDLDKIEL